MKSLLVLLGAFFALAAPAKAQRTIFILSPGIKLGYTFGDPGGFTFGAEVSYVKMINTRSEPILPYGFAYGPVINFDRFNRVTRIHVCMEVVMGVGLCIGPTLVIQSGQTHWGYSVIPFFGLFAYPYYNFTAVDGFTFHEVGSYLKGPILPKNYFRM
jgi:hypothetical protein